jgi:hypothetical protein
VLVEERLELRPRWLIDDVVGERRREQRHVRSIPRLFAEEQLMQTAARSVRGIAPHTTCGRDPVSTAVLA